MEELDWWLFHDKTSMFILSDIADAEMLLMQILVLPSLIILQTVNVLKPKSLLRNSSILTYIIQHN